MDEPVKKKRGRKPKEKSDDTCEVLEVIPKKRGRKPKKEVVSDKKIYNVNTEDNIILHLPINSDEINEISPKPYEDDKIVSSKLSDENRIYLSISNIIPKDQCNSENMDEILEEFNKQRKQEINYTNIGTDKYSYLFLDYLEYNKKKTWPLSTNIDCLWCCHEFDKEPYGIPIKREKDSIIMFGNFCCPQCAAAYNFDGNNKSEEIWERYSLMNMLYSKKEPIKIALPRLALKKFGGPFTIEEWRKNNGTKDFKVVMPPIISIIPTLEEITINSDNSLFNGISNEFIQKTSNDLRLKRNKPLPNQNNTLESCMNLKYV
jgi:hypothetical protein